MNQNQNLNEGLREGDLKGTIIPSISIDEYESKLSNNAVVIGFYALYQEPAKDLNRFIQKSSIDLLDTEVSPSPTPKGYYMVFVEMERDKNFIKDFLTIISNIQTLTSIKSWHFSTIKKNNIELSADNLKKYVLDESVRDKIKEFFYDSYLDKLIINEDNEIIFNNSKKYQILTYGTVDNITKKYNMNNIKLDESSTSKTLSFQTMLGEGWDIVLNDDLIMLNKQNQSIIIKELF